MSQQSSYNAKKEHRSLADEIERLRVQALLSWHQEARLLTWLGLQDGMTVLELGSGVGFVTEQLLSLLPHSLITAVEIDPDSQVRAKQLLQSHTRRVNFVQASVLNLGLPDNTHDFAVARLVFQHLQAPIEAAKQVGRVLKPGGKLAIVDIDAALWGIAEPYLPKLQSIYEKSVHAQASRGGDRLIGRRLWRILQAAGYTNLRLEAFVYHSDELGVEPFAQQMNPDRLLASVQAGFISSQELATAHLAYQQFRTSPNAYILMLGFIACGEKPLYCVGESGVGNL